MNLKTIIKNAWNSLKNKNQESTNSNNPTSKNEAYFHLNGDFPLNFQLLISNTWNSLNNKNHESTSSNNSTSADYEHDDIDDDDDDDNESSILATTFDSKPEMSFFDRLFFAFNLKPNIEANYFSEELDEAWKKIMHLNSLDASRLERRIEIYYSQLSELQQERYSLKSQLLKQKELYSKKLIAKTLLIKQLQKDLILERAAKHTDKTKKMKI